MLTSKQLDETSKCTMKGIIDKLVSEIGGRSYKSHKYCIDNTNIPSIDFGDHNAKNVWKSYGETIHHKS